MKKQALVLGVALILGVSAGGAFAHGDEDHGKDGKAAAAYDGHAAALGRPGDAKKATRTVKVTMNDTMRFTPDSIKVKKGETIRFEVTNGGKVKHEMVLGSMDELKEHAAMMRKNPEMEHDDPNAVSVQPGKTGSFVWQFSKTGNFDFGCLLPGHFEAGMVGKLAVSEK